LHSTRGREPRRCYDNGLAGLSFQNFSATPPRPGTPEYEAYRKSIDERGKHGAQSQDAKKSDAAQ
jgi:hypothetical protein